MDEDLVNIKLELEQLNKNIRIFTRALIWVFISTQDNREGAVDSDEVRIAVNKVYKAISRD